MCQEISLSCFIGFGSLVNTETHGYSALGAVRIAGWSRAWINNDTYDHAFLSVIPGQQTSILGLLARVPDANWSELDVREAGYDRRRLEPTEWEFEEASSVGVPPSDMPIDDVQMYVHSHGDFAAPDRPILRSYLETVLVGFHTVFGTQGVRSFIDTTTAWTRIQDDSVLPLYPRYVKAQGAALKPVQQALAEIEKK